MSANRLQRLALGPAGAKVRDMPTCENPPFCTNGSINDDACQFPGTRHLPRLLQTRPRSRSRRLRRTAMAGVGRAAAAILAAVRSRKQQGAMRRCLRPTDIWMRAQFRAFPLLDESLSNWSIGKRGHGRGRITGPMQRGFDLSEYYFRSITFYSTRASY